MCIKFIYLFFRQEFNIINYIITEKILCRYNFCKKLLIKRNSNYTKYLNSYIMKYFIIIKIYVYKNINLYKICCVILKYL